MFLEFDEEARYTAVKQEQQVCVVVTEKFKQIRHVIGRLLLLFFRLFFNEPFVFELDRYMINIILFLQLSMDRSQKFLTFLKIVYLKVAA
jgi:hypothetical protein